MKNWTLMFVGDLKPLVCSSDCRDTVLQQDGLSGHKLVKEEPLTFLYMDLPGPVSTNRTWQHFDVDGLSLFFPTVDLGWFYNALRNATALSGYYLLAGWLRCLALTQKQKDELLDAMEARIESTAEAAEKEEQAFNSALASIEEKQSEVSTVIELPTPFAQKQNSEKN